MFEKVISGEYAGKELMMHGGVPYISTSLFSKGVRLDTSNVSSYEVLDDETEKANPRKRQKNPPKILVAVTFYDGKRSLLELSEKYYKALIKSCFK